MLALNQLVVMVFKLIQQVVIIEPSVLEGFFVHVENINYLKYLIFKSFTMKKKQFKSGLNLNKNVISKLGINHIKGGVTTNSTNPACPESQFICGPRPSIDVCASRTCEPCNTIHTCNYWCIEQ